MPLPLPKPKPKPKADDRGGDRIVAKAKPKLLPAVSSRMQQGSTVAPPVVKPAAKPLPKVYGGKQAAPPPPKPSFQYGGNAAMLAKTKAWTPLQGLQGGKKPALPLLKGSKAQTSPQAKAEAKVAGYTPAPYGGNANAPATKAWTPSQGVQGGKEEFKYSPFVPPSPDGLDKTKLKLKVKVKDGVFPGEKDLSDKPVIPNSKIAKGNTQDLIDMQIAYAKGGRNAVSDMPTLTGLGLPDTIKNYASRDQEPIREAALQRLAAQDDYLTEMDYMSPDEMVSQVGQALAEVGTGAFTGMMFGAPFGPVGMGVGATLGTIGGIVVAGYDLLNSGELDPRKDERQTVVDERNRMLGLPDRLDPNRRVGGLLSGTSSFGPSLDRLLYGIPANELKGDNFPGPVGTLSTYFPQRDKPQMPPPAAPAPAGMTPADLIAWANSIRSQVNTKTGFSGKLEDPATAPNPAYVPKPPAAATTPAPIVPFLPPAAPDAPAAPAPEPGGGGDSGDGMSEFEQLAQLMEIGKYARQPVPEDRTRENELYNMLQESQNQMQALQQQYIEALIKQLNTQPQMGIPAPVGPGAPAAAAGNMYSLGGIPRVAPTGSNLQFSNAGLGYLNSIDPSLLQALMQYLKAMNYTGQGQMGSFGEMNYARQGGLGSLLQSDASFENPLAYAGLTPQMREPAEAGLRSLFAQMGLMG